MKKVVKKDIKLSDCNITNAKYNELRYFCKQYYEKKDELRHSYGSVSVYNNGASQNNTIGKPTEQTAIKNVMLRNDIELIEETAKETDQYLSSWLIKNVAEGIPYEWMDVPISRTKFYDARRYFFYLLSQKR